MCRPASSQPQKPGNLAQEGAESAKNKPFKPENLPTEHTEHTEPIEPFRVLVCSVGNPLWVGLCVLRDLLSVGLDPGAS